MSTWAMPGRIVEPSSEGLRAFGIESLPGARINVTDPPVSEKQRRFMGAELARRRAGKTTKTHMTEAQLRDFARNP